MESTSAPHYLFHTLGPPAEYRRSPTPFESHCVDESTLPRTLSTMYSLLIFPPAEIRVPGLIKWETELGRSLTPAQARQIIKFALKSSMSKCIQECIYKLLTKWFHTPSFQPPQTAASRMLLHIFWGCPSLETLWKKMRSLTQQFTDCQVPEDPAFFLLYCSDIPTTIYKKSVIRNLVNTAKLCIGLSGRSLTLPLCKYGLER